MSRTKHHRHQKHTHMGYDYGSRHNCNRHYGGGYGWYARILLHKELRQEDKEVVRNAINTEIFQE